MDNQEFKLSAILSIDIPDLSFSDEGDENPGSIEACHRLIEAASLSHKGNLIKAIGDSFILSFDNCQDAVKCAMDIAGRLSSAAASAAAPSPRLRARMGIHLGDVRFFERNVFGDAVDTASALQAAARPGSICVSAEVLSLVREKIALDASLLSEQRHKSLPAGIKAYEIQNAPASEAEPNPKRPPESAEKGPTLEEIRKAILEEIRAQGRRLTVDEAKRKFGWYGVEATEVIASLAESGILIGKATADRASWENYRRKEAPGYASANAAGDLGKSIETAIHSIVSEIERAVETGGKGGSQRPGESSGTGLHFRFDKDSFRESAMNFKEVGREIRRQVRESRHAERQGERRSERRASRSKGSALSTSSFDAYRAELSKKAGKLGKGIAGGIISFLAVNAGLWYLNLNYSKGFPWAAIVSVFWGFGLVDSVFSAIRISRQAREAEALPDLDDSQTKELKAIHKERDSIGKHFISALSIPSALALVNMATDRAIPGSSFHPPYSRRPSSSISSLCGHRPGRSRRFFEKLGIRGSRRGLEKPVRRGKPRRWDWAPMPMSIARPRIRRPTSRVRSRLRSIGSRRNEATAGGLPQPGSLLAKTANELDTIIGKFPWKP